MALETEGSPGDRGQPWRQGSPGDRGQPWRQRAALEWSAPAGRKLVVTLRPT
ncbi:hypothetical protein NQZ68_024302 [Dissostichus eleginoides]|nr:hypothetical protein NQZ68_024302 [Dissostichus eleginoides]